MSTEKSKNVVITKKARENLVKARAGAITLPKIIGMAFGEGGVNSSGTVIAPAESQSRLNKELFRKAIDGYTFPNDTTCRYECTLAESELAGKEISEIGLYDTNGDIVCIKTFTRKGKDDDVEQTSSRPGRRQNVKNYTPTTRNFSQSVPNVEVTDTNHADNINAAPKQLIENDNYLKDRMDDEGFSLVDGVLCQKFEE